MSCIRAYLLLFQGVIKINGPVEAKVYLNIFDKGNYISQGIFK